MPAARQEPTGSRTNEAQQSRSHAPFKCARPIKTLGKPAKNAIFNLSTFLAEFFANTASKRHSR